MPSKYRELAEAIRLKTPLEAAAARAPEISDYAVLLVPISILALLGYTFRLYGLFLNPLVYAAIGRVTAFSSMSCFVYKSWKRYRISNLGRLGSALAHGLMSGVTIFLFTLLVALL